MEVKALVRKSLVSQTELITNDEWVGFPASMFPQLGITPGMQVRVTRPGYASIILTTLVITGDAVRMGYNTRAKLGGGSDFEVTLSSLVAHSWISDAEARYGANLVERVMLGGNFILCMAPHGGDIEINTDEQARLLAERLAARGSSYWVGKGYDTPWPRTVNAHARWHTTSTEVSDKSFPMLGMALSQAPYRHAVAFHGFTDNDVAIGGLGSEALKRAVASSVAQVLQPLGINVRIVGVGDENSGIGRRNIVNRATLDGLGSIHIEQSRRVREDYWMSVTDAVARVLLVRP